MKGILGFKRRLYVQSLFIQHERGPSRSTSSKTCDNALPSTRADSSSSKTYRRPELIPFYDEFARIRNSSLRSSGDFKKDFSLSFFKARLYKLWKDVREGNQEAIVEDMNRWVHTVWYLEGLNFIAAQGASLNFELHMKETAVWKGHIVDLEFHLELHLEQSWAPFSDKVFPNRLKFLAPNLVDTGRFQIYWNHPSYLEIFDKGSQQKMIFTDNAPGGSFSTASFSLIDGTKIGWPAPDLPVTVSSPKTKTALTQKLNF